MTLYLQIRQYLKYNSLNQYNISSQKQLQLMEDKRLYILDLIQKMKTQQVNQAEQELMQLGENSQFMQIIFTIIKDHSLQGWVKTISSTFLNRFICQKLQTLGYKTMFTAISSILSSPQILASDKRCFERALVTLIEYIKQPQQIQEWIGFVLKYIDDDTLFDTGLLLISCTAVAETPLECLCTVIKSTFQRTLLKALMMGIKVENALIINELMKNWIVVFDKFKAIQKEEQQVQTIMSSMSMSQNLANILYQVYMLQAPKQVLLCASPQLSQLNLLKSQASQLHRRLSQQALLNLFNPSLCPLLKLISTCYNLIKNTIAICGATPSILRSYQCMDFITSLIGLIIVYVRWMANKINKDQMDICLHLLCFPFLGTDDEEVYVFEESPVEFNSLVEDVCDKQTFGVLKTQAAKLLEKIADSCPETIQSTLIFVIQCIKMKVSFIPSIPSNQIKILDLQTCFQILSIYSFSIQHYPNQLQSLRTILLDQRMLSLPPLQTSKIFLFLAYNYDELFKKNLNDGNIWIDFALTYRKHPTTRYMALDFISNISDQYFNQQFFKQFVCLINDREERQSGQLWNIIVKIFQHQQANINEDLCLYLVNCVFTRIQQQLVSLNNKKKQSTIDLINGLHILRRIIQTQQYISNKHLLLQRILAITIIFPQTVILNIQDQIIKILIESLKFNSIPQQLLSILPQILKQFKNQGFNDPNYYVLFNEIICKQTYYEIKQIIKVMLTAFMFHMFDKEGGKMLKQKVAVANVITILQNILTIHGCNMIQDQNNYFCQIGAMCIRLFPQKDQKVFSKTLLAKALNTMLLCHLHSKTQNTTQYIINYAKKDIFHKYDAYVLIKLLSKAIFTQDNIQIVRQYLNMMIYVTKQQQINEKKSKTQKTSKGKLKLKRDQQLSKILRKITCPLLPSQFQKSLYPKYPLREQVRCCLQTMKSKSIQTYKLIISNLNQEQKTDLAGILGNITQVEGKTRIIHKVKGIKEKPKHQVNQDQHIQEKYEDQHSFKRQRVINKKNQNNKRKNLDHISAQ